MISQHLKKWIFDNHPIFGINLGENVVSALNKLKNPALFGDKTNGYYYENGYRFGFFENQVDEIGLDFNRITEDVCIENEGEINLSQAKIHEVLNFLNQNLIEWKAIETKDRNYLYINIQSPDLVFIFDIFEGKLDKIAKSSLKVASR